MKEFTPIIEKLAYMPVRGRKVPFARTRGKDTFYNIGGKREAGESDEQALAREVMEEAGVVIVPGTARHLNTFVGPCHGYPEGTMLHMICYDAEYEGELVASSEVEEIAWFTTADMERTTEMGRAILAWFKEQDLID